MGELPVAGGRGLVQQDNWKLHQAATAGKVGNLKPITTRKDLGEYDYTS